MKHEAFTPLDFYTAAPRWSPSDRAAFTARWRAVYRSAHYMSPTEAYAKWGEPSTWPQDVYQHWLQQAPAELQQLLQLARRAVEAKNSDEGADIDLWARRLGEDVSKAGKQ